MKILYRYSLIIASVLFLLSCEKETEGISRITYYCDLTLNGDEAMTVMQGTEYTEKGAKAIAGGEDISDKIQISGSVNTSVPGVYTISYKATNSDGFSSITNRYVGVISADAASMNISGTYKRNAGAMGLVTVSKTNYPGLYMNNNPGGIANQNEVVVYMFHTQANAISAPLQSTSVGDFECDNGTYTAGAPNQFSWRCVNPGYGPAIRVFIQQ